MESNEPNEIALANLKAADDEDIANHGENTYDMDFEDAYAAQYVEDNDDDAYTELYKEDGSEND
jgi:hypothetical protein